jgi:hypothetical protein
MVMQTRLVAVLFRIRSSHGPTRPSSRGLSSNIVPPVPRAPQGVRNSHRSPPLSEYASSGFCPSSICQRIYAYNNVASQPVSEPFMSHSLSHIFSRNQTEDRQKYERDRSRKKRRRAWEKANPGMEYVDGRTRQARDKKRKPNSPIPGVAQKTPQSNLSLDEARPGPFEFEEVAQPDDMALWVQANPTLLDNAVHLEMELTSHSPLSETPLPAIRPNANADYSVQSSSDLNDPRSFLDQEGNPLVHPRTTDFASVVQGIELSESAPVIHWPGGFTTCVPFIAQEGDASKNILALVSYCLLQIIPCSIPF